MNDASEFTKHMPLYMNDASEFTRQMPLYINDASEFRWHLPLFMIDASEFTHHPSSINSGICSLNSVASATNSGTCCKVRCQMLLPRFEPAVSPPLMILQPHTLLCFYNHSSAVPLLSVQGEGTQCVDECSSEAQLLNFGPLTPLLHQEKSKLPAQLTVSSCILVQKLPLTIPALKQQLKAQSSLSNATNHQHRESWSYHQNKNTANYLTKCKRTNEGV